MIFHNILALDAGYCGAMVVGRQSNDGPEIVRQPYRWDWRSKARWEQHRAQVECDFVYLLLACRPALVAIEKPVSILHRRHVGVAQALQVGRWQHIAETAYPAARVVLVKGQGPKRAAQAWGVLRASVAELVDAEEFTVLNRTRKGEPGEHVADACAVFLRALKDEDLPALARAVAGKEREQ